MRKVIWSSYRLLLHFSSFFLGKSAALELGRSSLLVLALRVMENVCVCSSEGWPGLCGELMGYAGSDVAPVEGLDSWLQLRRGKRRWLITLAS